VTEIPEHLLRRSRERRAALGGGGDEEATAKAAEVTGETPTASAPVVATAAAPATQTGGGGAVAGSRAAPAGIEEPEAEPVRLGATRTKIPLWIMPVLAALPLWGIIYIGAFGPRHKAAANDPVAIGGQIYAANCAACHGVNGEGGVGPKMAGGEVIKTWPKVEDHISWVKTGGTPFIGKSYGSQGHTVPANNVMPAFAQANGGSLTDAQVVAVVCYERVSFGGETQGTTNCPPPGA